MALAKDDLPHIARRLEEQSPEQILRWACDEFGSKLCMATAFQAEGCAIIAMLASLTRDVFIFNLETGYQFPETLETRDRLIAKYGLPIALVRAEKSVREMEASHGGPIYDRNPDLCCHLRKIVPMRQAVRGYDAWITAIRRDQTRERLNMPILTWDVKFEMVKINPLAHWSKKDVWDYILKNDVPYNPLHDAGYPSIGCWPCTRAVGLGENDRDGRWSGKAKQECGLHVLNTPVK